MRMPFDWELFFTVLAMIIFWVLVFTNMGCSSFKHFEHHSCPSPSHGNCPICGKVDSGR
jgi:hypothetical protein